MTVREGLARAAEELARHGVPSPRVDAEHLLCKALDCSRTALYLEPDRRLAIDEEVVFTSLVDRRSRREPLAYVLGEWGFRRLTLATDRRALVPRPETEVVVERCLALIADMPEPAVLDVGVGSGAIALAVADEHPGARVTGIDASPDALALAAENARRTGLAVDLLRHDLSDGLPPGPYDLVVSNPPYVPESELGEVEPEVRDWEPRDAVVDGGQTAALIREARDVLKPGGWLALETHWHSAAGVRSQLVEHGYVECRVSKDLAGRERIVEGRWR